MTRSAPRPSRVAEAMAKAESDRHQKDKDKRHRRRIAELNRKKEAGEPIIGGASNRRKRKHGRPR